MVLATLVTRGLSWPRPDDDDDGDDDGPFMVPEVGQQKRSQFYFLRSDGTFKYGFDTGEGLYELVESKKVGERNGKYGYVDPEGKHIRLEYEAGKDGFVARGDHLPTPSPEIIQALADVVAAPLPFVDPQADENSDGSYGFHFEAEDHSRSERSDSNGTVTGSYAYVDNEGKARSFAYKAGKGIGFVIEENGLLQEMSEPTSYSNIITEESQNVPQSVLNAYKSPYTQKSSNTAPTSPYSQNASHSANESPYFLPLSPDYDVFTHSQTRETPHYSFFIGVGDKTKLKSSNPNSNGDKFFSFKVDPNDAKKIHFIPNEHPGDDLNIVPRGESSRHYGFDKQINQTGEVDIAFSNVESGYMNPSSNGQDGKPNSTNQEHSSPLTPQFDESKMSFFFSNNPYFKDLTFNTNDKRKGSSIFPNEMLQVPAHLELPKIFSDNEETLGIIIPVPAEPFPLTPSSVPQSDDSYTLKLDLNPPTEEFPRPKLFITYTIYEPDGTNKTFNYTPEATPQLKSSSFQETLPDSYILPQSEASTNSKMIQLMNPTFYFPSDMKSPNAINEGIPLEKAIQSPSPFARYAPNSQVRESSVIPTTVAPSESMYAMNLKKSKTPDRHFKHYKQTPAPLTYGYVIKYE